MDALSYFAHDYAGARDKFREAARTAGARLTEHVNPASGPEGLPLTTDVAALGPPNAATTLIVNSGTHGAEGFFGSAVQVGWLRGRAMRPLPAGLQVVLVHAINPFGFAWLRRTNEDNIDLNRNFIDHDKPHPICPGYDVLHPAILPVEWSEASRAAFAAAYRDYSEEHGETATQAAITAGQYEFADGLFYGGRKPSWSNQLVRRLAAEHTAGSERVHFIDLHTGLGSWSYIEIIHRHLPDSEGEAWLERAYGTHSLGSLARADSVSVASKDGLVEVGVRQALGGKPLIACTLEVGTQPVPQVLEALRADNWLHIHGKLDSDLGRQIKAQVLEAFCRPEPAWRELVSLRGRQILDSTLAGIGG